LTGAGIVACEVATQRVGTTGVGFATLINVSAFNLSVALKAWLTLADVLRGEITAFRVFNTLGS